MVANRGLAERAAFFFALSVAFLATTISAGASPPQPRAATGFVAVTTGSGSSQISTFKLNGTGAKQLTTGPANHYSPRVSPDGTKILYVGEDGGNYEIYSMGVDGTRIAPVTKAPAVAAGASWSPDGASIAYSAKVAGAAKFQVFLTNPDGSSQRQLTHTTDSDNFAPVFSPNGGKIAYVNAQTSVATGALSSQIWTMDAGDGAAAAPLTHGTGDNYPAWVNDQSLLFARLGADSQTSQVFDVSLNGTEKSQSPTGAYLTEPKPLLNTADYGASELTGTSLRIVKISPAGATFNVAPLVSAGALGDTFSVDWILTAVPSTPTLTGSTAATSMSAVLIGAGILVVLAAVGGAVLLAQRKSRVTVPRSCANAEAEVASAEDAVKEIAAAADAHYRQLGDLTLHGAIQSQDSHDDDHYDEQERNYAAKLKAADARLTRARVALTRCRAGGPDFDPEAPVAPDAAPFDPVPPRVDSDADETGKRVEIG